MKNYVHVIPHKLVEQLNEVNEIPTGVDIIQAPKIWEKQKEKELQLRCWIPVVIQTILT